MKSCPVVVLVMLLAAAIVAQPAAAETITLTLDGVTVTECGSLDQEGLFSLWFEETTAEDLTSPFCIFVNHVYVESMQKTGVYISPARLVVDLSGTEGIETIEIDIYETHFAGSTRAFVYERGGTGLVASTQSFQEDAQTLVLNPNGAAIGHLAISAHESYIWDIRLIGTVITPNEDISFGSIKATYR